MTDKYEQLEQDIKMDIETSDKLYGDLKLKTAIKYDDYKLDVGYDFNEYRAKIWDYFNLRYKQQSELQTKYKKLYNKLKHKQELLNKMRNETEKASAGHSTIISNIKTTKRELDGYHDNNKTLYFIMIFLLITNIIIIIYLRYVKSSYIEYNNELQ